MTVEQYQAFMSGEPVVDGANESAAAPVQPAESSSRAPSSVVSTFMQTCNAQLGNPSGIVQAAQQIGFSGGLGSSDAQVSEIIGGQLLFNPALDQTVQVNVATSNAFECAVTTSDVADPLALKAEFYEAVGVKGNRNMVNASINGKAYTYKFDTRGGEALVVFSN
ncbi:hypothetical protein [Aliiroseovarius crassostreae]|nr:hypothetical protein [Aliiroseovarius crassostreae]